MTSALDSEDAETAHTIKMRLRPLARRHRIAHLKALLRRGAICSRRRHLLSSLLSEEAVPRDARRGRA